MRLRLGISPARPRRRRHQNRPMPELAPSTITYRVRPPPSPAGAVLEVRDLVVAGTAATVRRIPHRPDLELDQGTLLASVVAAPGSIALTRCILGRLRSGPQPHTGDIALRWAGDLRFELNTGETSAQSYQARASGVLREGVPAAIMATFGPAGMRLHVGGRLVATHPHTGGVPATAKGDWLIGARGVDGVIGSIWRGRISLALYGRVLTVDEATAIMQGWSTPFGDGTRFSDGWGWS